MKKIVKKITIEEFQNGELVKRTIEETTEEVKSDDIIQPITLPKAQDPVSPWAVNPNKIGWSTVTGNDNMVLLCNNK